MQKQPESSEKVWEVSEMDFVHFNFEGMALREACWFKGKPYFTGRAIGEFLEYSDPVRDISHIIRRNPHINDERWSVVVRLTTTDGKKYPTKVYDPIGLQLIIFESQQPKAVEFKITAAHLVYAMMRGEIKPSKWTTNRDLLAASRQILSLPQGNKRADLVRDLAEQQGCSIATAYRRIQRASGERLKNRKGKPINRQTKGASFFPDEKEKALAYAKANPTTRGAHIKKTLNLTVSASRINAWLRSSFLP